MLSMSYNYLIPSCTRETLRTIGTSLALSNKTTLFTKYSQKKHTQERRRKIIAKYNMKINTFKL